MTDMTFSYARSRGSGNKIGQLCALGRYGVAEGQSLIRNKVCSYSDLTIFSTLAEIAQSALFLASGRSHTLSGCSRTLTNYSLDDSSYVNGQNIAVDGGLSASHPVMPGRWA